MPKYSRELIDEVIEANSIVDVVSGYVTLKKTGRNYTGLCPFHNEKTPSFSVSPDKNLFYCFGCQEGGSTIDFLMKIENIDFLEALEMLAARAGITLPKTGDFDEARDNQKKRFYQIHRDLANFYYVNLKRNEQAKNYVLSRGIDQNIRKDFGIGFAPNAWRAGIGFLTERGHTIDDMIACGVAIRNDRGDIYDRFRNRLMIPILNSGGKVIGFGGRKMNDDDNGPKYLNSPDTPIFNKGYELFNLNQAKKNIRGDQLIVVEGYMDVIALCQNGVKNCVASLGTSFTLHHAKLIGRYAKEIVLCFDGDEAGNQATQKALTELKDSRVRIKVLRLDPKDDPDSFIRREGTDAFNQVLKNAMTSTSYLLKELEKPLDMRSEDGRIKYAEGAINILSRLDSDVSLSFYAKQIAGQTGISEQVILGAVQKNGEARDRAIGRIRLNYQAKTKKIKKAYAQAQCAVLRLAIEEKSAKALSQFSSSYFSKGFYRNVFEAIMDCANDETPIDAISVMSVLADEKDINKLQKLLVSQDEDLININFDEAADIINKNYLENEITRITSEIKLCDPEDTEQRQQLLKQLTVLKTVQSNKEEANGKR